MTPPVSSLSWRKAVRLEQGSKRLRFMQSRSVSVVSVEARSPNFLLQENLFIFIQRFLRNTSFNAIFIIIYSALKEFPLLLRLLRRARNSLTRPAMTNWMEFGGNFSSRYGYDYGCLATTTGKTSFDGGE